MKTVVAGVVLLMAAVAGCSAGDAAPAEVGPLASSSSSASPADQTTDASAGLTASAPPVGAAPGETATKHPATVDGASAFAREYVRLIGQGFAEADSRAVRQRSAPGCEGCDALIRAMDDAERAGLRQRGGDYEVSSVATPPFESGDVVLLLTYSRGASEIVDVAGATVDRGAAVPATTVQMRLVYGSGGWLTQGYRIV